MRKLLALVPLISLAMTTAAAAAGDSKAGQALAERWCSSCHVVEPGGKGVDTAPPFAVIAQEQGNNPAWVRTWLTDPHPPMQNITLSRQQIDDIQAYLWTFPKK